MNLLVCLYFVIVINEIKPDKAGLIKGATKIREFSRQVSNEKNKVLGGINQHTSRRTLPRFSS